tara:strand:+ start:230 stop:991 length:762 start_codon:yes stop_codon:yes gene_type:complete
MKVFLLAGGFGTRLAEYSNIIPKPMVRIGDKPILWRIMKTFANYGHHEFYVALGYKAEVIKDYFLNYYTLNSDLTIDLSSGEIKTYKEGRLDWKITLLDTGISTMTGGRLKRMKDYIKDEPFFLTYGDGLCDVNLNDLLSFHKSHGKLVTVTAVHPGARFGELLIENNEVITFQEKPQTQKGWINGGYFIMQPEFINLIDDDSSILEKDPLENASKIGELMAFKHEGFWQCMDTKRDKDNLEDLLRQGKLDFI